MSEEGSAWRAAVITVSDRSSRGEREDLSGPAVAELLEANGYPVVRRMIVPDERGPIEEELRSCVWEGIPLVLTTGGTGFSPRDVTPEATEAIIERRADGLTDLMRRASIDRTKYAALSRATSGIAGGTLIVNLPGSPNGARECLEAILPVLPHGLRLLTEREDDHRQ